MGGEWYPENPGSRKILVRSGNLGSLFDKSRSLVFCISLCLGVFGRKVSGSRIFYFSRGSRSKCIVVSEESQCRTARSLHSTYSSRSLEGRPEERNGCLKWHACPFDQVSADNNNTLIMKFQTPY